MKIQDIDSLRNILKNNKQSRKINTTMKISGKHEPILTLSFGEEEITFKGFHDYISNKRRVVSSIEIDEHFFLNNTFKRNNDSYHDIDIELFNIGGEDIDYLKAICRESKEIDITYWFDEKNYFTSKNALIYQEPKLIYFNTMYNDSPYKIMFTLKCKHVDIQSCKAGLYFVEKVG